MKPKGGPGRGTAQQQQISQLQYQNGQQQNQISQQQNQISQMQAQLQAMQQAVKMKTGMKINLHFSPYSRLRHLRLATF